jgi:hypothetical protein
MAPSKRWALRLLVTGRGLAAREPGTPEVGASPGWRRDTSGWPAGLSSASTGLPQLEHCICVERRGQQHFGQTPTMGLRACMSARQWMHHAWAVEFIMPQAGHSIFGGRLTSVDFCPAGGVSWEPRPEAVWWDCGSASGGDGWRSPHCGSGEDTGQPFWSEGLSVEVRADSHCV